MMLMTGRRPARRPAGRPQPGPVCTCARSARKIQAVLADRHVDRGRDDAAHLEECQERIAKVLTASMTVND